jgi:hypothetical protein
MSYFSGTATLSDGNVLLGPCSGTDGDPSGQYRGRTVPA